MKVIAGSLKETRFAWPKENEHKMNVIKETVLNLNEAAYIHDKIGLHRVSNTSPTDDAVSLHLYTPPYEYCKTFCEDTAEVRVSGKCVFYSKFGKKEDVMPINQPGKLYISV